MITKRDELNSLFESLKQQRDELILQLHLGKADAKDELEEIKKEMNKNLNTVQDDIGEDLRTEWQKLEKTWDEFKETAETRYDSITEDVLEAKKQVGETLKQNYEQLQKYFH